jgi:hypothetical protein
MRTSNILPALVLSAAMASGLLAQTAPSASKTQQLLAQAAREQKFTFIMFYKQNDATAQAVAKTLSEGVAKRADRAVATYVLASDPGEQAVVARFGVARSPMPITLAVAPNGAITGVFQQQQLADASLDTALVTPAMSRCMKAMQEKKLVILCAQPPNASTMPNAVRHFQADPHFNQRLAVVALQVNDPAEARFVQELELAQPVRNTTMVFMAPPGVMIGKYGATATQAQMATDLHKAGKCCDNPNCPHNH